MCLVFEVRHHPKTPLCKITLWDGRTLPAASQAGRKRSNAIRMLYMLPEEVEYYCSYFLQYISCHYVISGCRYFRRLNSNFFPSARQHSGSARLPQVTLNYFVVYRSQYSSGLSNTPEHIHVYVFTGTNTALESFLISNFIYSDVKIAQVDSLEIWKYFFQAIA